MSHSEWNLELNEVHETYQLKQSIDVRDVNRKNKQCKKNVFFMKEIKETFKNV